MLGPDGQGGQGGQSDFEIIDAPPLTLPSLAEDPDPLEGQDYVPANTLPGNTVPGTDTRELSETRGETYGVDTYLDMWSRHVSRHVV